MDTPRDWRCHGCKMERNRVRALEHYRENHPPKEDAQPVDLAPLPKEVWGKE